MIAAKQTAIGTEREPAIARDSQAAGTVPWPNGKRFAFSAFDDTDFATLEKVGPVYAFLKDLGIRTTKSVWPVAGNRVPVMGGATCEDREYREWVLGLQEAGFEIGLHNVTYHTSTREETIRGFDEFRRLFGRDPKTLTNHTSSKESIYWHGARLTGKYALLFHLLTAFRLRGRARGHLVGDPHFWGDICRERVRYVRNFVFRDVNTLGACPWMPYHDPARPFVNYWFASAPGRTCTAFNRTLAEANQDRLEEEGGACIMYTHFACGFCENGSLDPRFRQLMERLARKNGYFAPVSEVLDHILAVRGHHEITASQRAVLERRWLLRKIGVGTE